MKALLLAFVAALAACTTPYDGSASASAAVVSTDPAPASAQKPTTDLYYSAKGDPKSQAIVFIHGGPGSNCKTFELSVQDSLAALGYYVVAYDQRGSLRSPVGTTADYSFAKGTRDLDDLIGALGLEKPILIAHSFGGALALQYLERFKGRAKGAVLVAAPMNYPETYDTTLTQCADRYRGWGRSQDANDVDAVHAKMFPNGVTPPYEFTNTQIDSTIGCMNDAKLYFPPLPTMGELEFAVAGGLSDEVAAVNANVGAGYQANDQLSYSDFTNLLASHKSEVQGIYAPDWDVMFSAKQLQEIGSNVTAFATVPNSGHFIFIDQPDAFLSALAPMLERVK